MTQPLDGQPAMPPLARTFNTASLVRLTGVSLRQINHWDKLGLVSPCLEAARGSGSRRRYTDGDAALLLVAKQLRDRGLALDTVRRALSAVRRAAADGQPVSSGYLVLPSAGRPKVIRQDADLLGEVQASLTITVPLAPIAQQVADLHTRVARPEPASVSLGSDIYPAWLLPADDGRSFEATCGRWPDEKGTGPSSRAALADLQATIERQLDDNRATQRRQGDLSRSAPSRPSASTWGDNW